MIHGSHEINYFQIICAVTKFQLDVVDHPTNEYISQHLHLVTIHNHWHTIATFPDDS